MELFCTYYSGINLNPRWDAYREKERKRASSGGRKTGRKRQSREGKGKERKRREKRNLV